GKAIMLNGPRSAARLTKDGDGYSAASSDIPNSISLDGMFALWAASEEEQWLSGYGIVLRVKNAWGGGAFEISTIALRAAPVRSNFFQIRGTSNTNIWAIGGGYALHKTSP